MTLIVTGAAGFIGSNIVKALNQQGERDIVAVDNLQRADKVANLADLDIADFVDKREFLARLQRGAYGKVRAVLHQGACSDTMESDGVYMMHNNYEYSLSLLDWCQQQRVPYLYASSASVYGAGPVFKEDRQHEKPLNVYAYSKFLFDQRVRRVLPQATAQIAGFRYFNVYGPREQHKARMASVAFHHTHQFRAEGHVRLFGPYDGHEAGQQLRDFIHVDDVVKVNLWFLNNPQVSGIVNVGTGRAQSFNEVSETVINTLRELRGDAVLSRPELIEQGLLRYIDFPDALKGKYQSYTQADLDGLRALGYTDAFLTVQQGVARYVRSLVGAA